MKGKNLSSIVATFILLTVAIYMFYTTGNYMNSTIWVVAAPLFLSLHPVFREDAKKMKITKEEHEKLKATLNFIRFSLFSLGMLMFLIQVFNDF